MKKVVGLFALLLVQGSIATHAEGNLDAKLDGLFDHSRRPVYVAAHRGDWRDTPENSIRALQQSVAMGVDIVEFDLKKTKDNHLVVMHDASLDRTTTGKGLVSDHTLAELQGLQLRAATGHPTAHRIPTFSQELSAARGTVLLDIDQGWNFLPEVIQEVQAAGMIRQVIVNVRPDQTYSELIRESGPIPEDLTIMIVVNMAHSNAPDVIRSYKTHARTVVQCIFADAGSDTIVALRSGGSWAPLWINSLWPEQNSKHDDDLAVEGNQPDESWGWLVKNGANVLQTDRPREMLQYLRKQGLHP